MNKSWMIALSLAPFIAGCSVFESNVVPPGPALTGVNAQNAALQSQIKRVRDGEARFAPLDNAREALTAAEAQPDVEQYAANELAGARSALEEAEQGWQGLANKQRPADAKLVAVAEQAHRARRLAEIARYTAVREINLEKLIAVNDELKARGERSAPASGSAPAAGAGEVQPVSPADRKLVGQQVVPDRFGDVSFETGTARMKAESQAAVRQLADLLKAHPTVGVAIFGHTDSVGPAPESIDRFVAANPGLDEQAPTREDKVRAFNLALSAARARAVAQQLVENGVPARRIGARGFGDTQPVASNDTAEGRRANRRIEAVIVPGPDSPEARSARSGS
ncbi:OmpA family protein [Salinisphaera sp.]|uniref:OmpA family protein n=1 Tax=Salinisphaera sp. TaxID=1914330 RepID=UPI0025E71478|nr:OmpA family protein [Salinisphaera sp.]